MKEVEAVKTKEDIRYVEDLLRKHGGDLYADLWRIGVNMALRISDLLKIKYEDLDMDKEVYELHEGKTKKKRTIKLNATVLNIVNRRMADNPSDTYLFQVHSNRTKGMEPKPVSRISVARRFKEVGEIIRVHLGTHSMRKSRGWAMFSDGVPIEILCKMFNHSHPAVTMTYLGITKQEVLDTYDAYEL